MDIPAKALALNRKQSGFHSCTYCPRKGISRSELTGKEVDHTVVFPEINNQPTIETKRRHSDELEIALRAEQMNENNRKHQDLLGWFGMSPLFSLQGTH